MLNHLNWWTHDSYLEENNMKGLNGIQMQVHPKMIEFKKKVKNERIRIGKEGSGELSDKRLTLTFVRLLTLPENYIKLVNADIDPHEN
jgi:hypothetical protein